MIHTLFIYTSFETFQLVSALAFFCFLSSLLAKLRVLRIALLVLGVCFFAAQNSSLIFGNAFIDYKYYIHVKFDVINSTSNFFKREVAIIIFSLFIGLLISFLYSTYLSKWINKHKKVGIFLAFISLGCLCLPNGIMSSLQQIAEVHFAKKMDFEDAIHTLGYRDFKTKEEIVAAPGSNIIVLVLESLEFGFLTDEYSHLTPNLRKLKNQFHFHKMSANVGSNYTLGSLYTYATGVPGLFKNHGNQIFSGAKQIQWPSIYNILDKAGYNQLYMMGNPSFAGTGNMLELLGVQVKSENDYDKKYKIDTWGLHDKDLFFLAKKEIQTLKQADEPFALFLSTISTHHPDGIKDERVSATMPNQRTQLELMISALDKEIGDLYAYVVDNDLIENTSLFIIPDHLLMGKSTIVKESLSDRSLFMISSDSALHYASQEEIAQIDVPDYILNAAGVNHNYNFLTNVLRSKETNYVTEPNRTDTRGLIIKANESSLLDKRDVPFRVNKLEKNIDQVFFKSVGWKDKNRNIASYFIYENQDFNLKRGINILKYQDALSQYSLHNYDTFEDEEAVVNLIDELHSLIERKARFFMIVHDSAGDNLSAFESELEQLKLFKLAQISNRKSYVAYSENGFTSELISNEIIESDILLNNYSSERDLEIMYDQSRDTERIIAHAGGAIEGYRYTNCLEALDLSYKRGYRKIELDLIKTSDDRYVAYHDWKSWKKTHKFEGDDIPTLKEFMGVEIKGKYSPMNMGMINSWFAKHEDAILVTDKVDDPKDFIDAFAFPNRLIMELFTTRSINEANEIGFNEIMLTQNLWNELKGDKLEYLRKNNINMLALSIHTILKRPEYYKKLHESGIRIFAFHINDKKFLDETFMIRKGLDYCYGFYADYWSLNN